jgi:DNA-binding transcriptional regulator YiaG
MFYNPELATTELYTEVWRLELIRVRDVDDLLVLNHYWKDSNGELWGDFTDPMENVRRGFAAYRQRKGYLTPNEIRNIRQQLKMSVREFADLLGIGSSTLTQIENDQRVQVKYQEILFELIKDRIENNKSLPAKWKNNDSEITFNSNLKYNLNEPYEVNRKFSYQKTFYNMGDAA